MVIIGDSIVGFREWSLLCNGLMNLNHGLGHCLQNLSLCSDILQHLALQ
jgi:hypothetical protein